MPHFLETMPHEDLNYASQTAMTHKKRFCSIFYIPKTKACVLFGGGAMLMTLVSLNIILMSSKIKYPGTHIYG